MKILLAWELGGNLGHVTGLIVLARGLRERGHEVTFSVKDVRGCAQLLQQNRFAYVQAPTPSTHPSKVPRDPASEQLLLARNVASLGAGAVVYPQGLGVGLAPFVSSFLRNEASFAQARAFAGKYKNRDQSKKLSEVIRSIDQLIRRPRSESSKGLLYDPKTQLLQHR
jgi:hypothetical protein